MGSVQIVLLTEPTHVIAEAFTRWENDARLIPLARPNQMAKDLERREVITPADLAARIQQHHIYLIFLDGQLVGEMTFQVDPQHLMKHETRTAWISIMIGEEHARGQGVGRQALVYLEQQIRAYGLTRIELGVFAFNTAAQRLYQRMGYQEIGRIEAFTSWNSQMWADIRMEKYLEPPELNYGLALPYGSARSTARLAQLAEQAGWDGCFVGDAIWTEDAMICLAAAAIATSRIRLGTMVIPMPLRRPWKVASESLALDRLSDGRLILGLGTGAVWMGWQGFPDEVTDASMRGEMLDESIDILTLLYQGRPFDYNGRHYHLKLTELDVQHYPPRPVQQPRIPLWVPVLWPRKQPMRRALKCDGLLAEKIDNNGQPAEVTPADISAMKACVVAKRTHTTPFDLVVSGSSAQLEPSQRQEHMQEWHAAGATWWIEACWGLPEAAAAERISAGPPQII